MNLTRREFVFAAAAAAAASRQRDPHAVATAADTHDEALEELAKFGPDYAGGLSNHAPMAIEALAILRQPDAIKAWLTNYQRRLQPAPAPGAMLAANARDAALGQRGAYADWEATFTVLLREAEWRTVVGDWQRTLLPGMVGALAHGVIRTAHAVRALAAKDTPPRRRELARALAYQASTHQPLLGAPGDGTQRPLAVLPRVPLLPDEHRKLQRGPSDRRIAEATSRVEFARIAGTAGPAAATDSDAFLAELLRTAAQQFTRHGTTSPIFFCHAFTAVGAVQALWPCLDATSRSLACRHAWQLVAAIQSRFAVAPFVVDELADAKFTDEIAERAVANGDEHAIKLTAACAVAWRADARPEFVAAASRALELL